MYVTYLCTSTIYGSIPTAYTAHTHIHVYLCSVFPLRTPLPSIYHVSIYSHSVPCLCLILYMYNILSHAFHSIYIYIYPWSPTAPAQQPQHRVQSSSFPPIHAIAIAIIMPAKGAARSPMQSAMQYPMHCTLHWVGFGFGSAGLSLPRRPPSFVPYCCPGQTFFGIWT